MPLGTVKGRMRLGLEKIRVTLAERMGVDGPRRCCRERDATRARALRDDLAAYALGALDAPTRRRALEAHLDGCEHCRDRLRWLEPGGRPAAGLGRAASTPPPSLRESLMATVRAEAARAPRAPSRRRAEPARESWWAGLRGLMLRPATGMAVADPARRRGRRRLRAARLGHGRDPTELVEAEPLGDAGAGRRRRSSASGDSATLHVHELPALDATRSTRSGSSAPG